jgi:hypothetical protein
MSYSSFEDLDVWKRSSRLAVQIYEVLKDCLDYGLKDQTCRAAISIASNIAEGAERDSKKEFIRFLHIPKVPQQNLELKFIPQQKLVLWKLMNRRRLLQNLWLYQKCFIS